MSMRNLRSISRCMTTKQSTSADNKTAPSSKESPSNGIEALPLVDEMRVTDDDDNEAENKLNAVADCVRTHNDNAGNNEEDITESAGLLIKSTTAASSLKPFNKSNGKVARPPGNELTHLIPGYTAPMRLESKLSVGHQSGSSGSDNRGIANHATSLSNLRQRASLAEVARYIPPTITNKTQRPLPTTTSFLSTGLKPSNTAPTTTATTSFVSSSSYRKTYAKSIDHTAGAGWFHMNPTPMTSQLKTDLSLIRNRNYLDPKKFYKSADSFDGKVLQVGTVIEGSAEYYSSRLTRKERRMNITEELMADANVRQYAKRKFLEIQMERDRSGSRYKGGGGGGNKKKKNGRKGR